MRNSISQNNKSQIISVKEVCEKLDISIPTFYKRYNEFPFPVDKVGHKYIISRPAFERYLYGISDEE